jgi:hypothetical protein
MTPKEIKEYRHLRKVKKTLGLNAERKKRYRHLKIRFKKELTLKERRMEKLRSAYNKVSTKMGLADPAPRVSRKEEAPRHIDMGLPIKDEVQVHLKQRLANIAKQKAQVEAFGPDLLHLFNVEHVDFVKKMPDGRIVPVTWPKQATHKLMPTLWPDKLDRTKMVELIPDRENRTNLFGKIISTGYDGIAHAVALIPMKKPVPTSDLVLARPLSRWSKRWPPYKTEWEISQKRRALLEYASHTGVFRKMKPVIVGLNHEQCNALLKEFIKASWQMRAEMKKDPKMKAFWKKRKAALAEKKKQESAKPKAQPEKPKTFLEHFSPNERKIISEALTGAVKYRQLG